MKKFLLIALLCVSVNAGAYRVNGNQLLPLCQEVTQGCFSYVISAVDTYDQLVDWGFISKEICVPGMATNEQFVSVIVKHLKKIPEELHTAASGHVLNALGLAFPCTARFKVSPNKRGRGGNVGVSIARGGVSITPERFSLSRLLGLGESRASDRNPSFL